MFKRISVKENSKAYPYFLFFSYVFFSFLVFHRFFTEFIIHPITIIIFYFSLFMLLRICLNGIELKKDFVLIYDEYGIEYLVCKDELEEWKELKEND